MWMGVTQRKGCYGARAPCLGCKAFVYPIKKKTKQLSLLLASCRLLRSLGALSSTLSLSPPTPVISVPWCSLGFWDLTVKIIWSSNLNILQEKTGAFGLKKSHLYFLKAITRSMLWDSNARIKVLCRLKSLSK